MRTKQLSSLVLSVGMSLVAIPVEANADLALEKSARPDPVVVDREFDYTITVTNVGPLDAADVVVSDTLPASVILVSATSTQGTCASTTTIVCNLDTISPTSRKFVTIKVVASAIPGAVINSASVTSSSLDPNLANNSANASVSVVPVSLSADLSLTLQVAEAGGRLTYTIFVTNNGPAMVVDAKLSQSILPLLLSVFNSAVSTQGFCLTRLDTCIGLDCLFALGEPFRVSCDLGSLGAGATATVTVTTSGAGGEPTVFASANVSSSTADPDRSNNAASEDTMITSSPPAFAGDSGGGGCFIATAAYGTPMAEDVRWLRAFRDEYLMTNPVGRTTLRLYYRYSPPLADYIRQDDDVRALVRTGLAPLVALSKAIVSTNAFERK